MGQGTSVPGRRLTYHLHCHLEPAERKWRQLGIWKREIRGSPVFFERHNLDGKNVKTSLEDLQAFLRELHDEQAHDGCSYVEVRLSPRRFLIDGYHWQDILSPASRTVMSMTEPEVRLILLVNRDSPEDFVLEVESMIESGLPRAFVGIDLAGDELRFPDVGPFKRCFSKGAKSGLGVTVHAGEFGGEANVWAALDELGAQQIGHGIASASSRSLLRRLSVDHILMELSITSNLALGAVPSADAHPLPDLMNWGIPGVCQY